VGLIWELGSFSASETVRLDLLTRGRCEVSGVCCDWTRWPCGGCQIGELRAWVRRQSLSERTAVAVPQALSALPNMADNLPVNNRKPPLLLPLHIAKRSCDFF
jgi:hypothetical protein